MNLTHKSLGYAYPTSTMATNTGFGKSGCWHVDLVDSSTWKTRIQRAFADKAEATAFMATLDYPTWHYSK